MNIVDLIIVIIALGAIARGVKIGLFRQALSVAGFFIGLFAGSLIAPKLVALSDDMALRALMTVIITLGLGLLLSGVGEYLGSRLSSLAKRYHFNMFDAVLGAFFEIGVVLISSWLIAASVTSLPFYNLGRVVRQSAIISALNEALPPAPGLIARLGRLITPNGFPKVFVGQEPSHSPTDMPTVNTRAALDRDGASTVKIEGVGCGGIVSGSGFVAGPGFVATNAHVIAGVRRPVIIDNNGRHQATPIWFNADLDFAVLRADNLAGAPLALVRQDEPVGTTGVVLGYPDGGPLTAGSAVILDRAHALGRDIYDSSLTYRDIYALQAEIQPGNSGGPLVLADGSVIGIVFAKAITNDQTGYALTSAEVSSDLSRAEARSQPVGTGSCAD